MISSVPQDDQQAVYCCCFCLCRCPCFGKPLTAPLHWDGADLNSLTEKRGPLSVSKRRILQKASRYCDLESNEWLTGNAGRLLVVEAGFISSVAVVSSDRASLGVRLEMVKLNAVTNRGNHIMVGRFVDGNGGANGLRSRMVGWSARCRAWVWIL